MANLAYGSSGSDVRALQEALKAQGYNIGTGGVFNAQTRAAVRDYQQRNGLAVDGIAGSQTLGALGIGGGSTGGSNYGGSNSYGGSAGGGSNYNNSGLTTDQIVEMQNYYGTAADGLWGQNSTAAAGGLNAQQAWQQYQQQKQQQAQQQMQETLMPSMMGFEAFYNRMGGADFEKMLRENINASVQQAVNSYEAQRQETEQDAQEMARQAYVAKLLGEKNMAQRLAAGGYAGGMAESAMLESETNYQNNLAEIQRQRQRALDEIQRAIDNARLTGDMEMANQLADYMAQVQSYYSDYYDQMLNQQMQMQMQMQRTATPITTYQREQTPIVAPVVDDTPKPATTIEEARNQLNTLLSTDANGNTVRNRSVLRNVINNMPLSLAQKQALLTEYTR